MCRYHDTNIIEKVFRSTHRMASFLPDKVYRKAEDMWYHVFERDKKSVAMLQEHQKFFGTSPSKKLFSTSGKYWLPVGQNNDAPQALVVIDSLPSLVPERIDEEEREREARQVEAQRIVREAAAKGETLDPIKVMNDLRLRNQRVELDAAKARDAAHGTANDAPAPLASARMSHGLLRRQSGCTWSWASSAR